MTAQGREGNYKARYRPYLIAMALAFVLTMIVAPERMEEEGILPPASRANKARTVRMD